MFASLSLVMAACTGSDEKSSKKPDKQSTSTTTTERPTDETTTTLDNGSFSTAIDGANTAIEKAGTDPCKLMDALDSAPPTPVNSTQSRQLVETYVKLLNAVAGALPPTSENVEVLKNAADDVMRVAEKLKFSSDLMSSDEFGKVMASEKVNSAMSEFTALTEECKPPTTEGTVPGAPNGGAAPDASTPAG